MAVYVYKHGDANALQAERIGLFGAHIDDVESERHRLVNAGMNAALKREADAREVTKQLAQARSNRLPAEFVSRLMAGGFYEAQVAEEPSGLAMRAPAGEGTPNFIVDAKKVADTDELITIAVGHTDDPVFSPHFIEQVITHRAVQYEPFLADRTLQFRSHQSFGRIGVNGYEPVLSVLGEEHAVVQAVAASAS